MTSLPHPDKTMASPAIPFAVAGLGIALFSVMDGVMKGLSIEIGAYNALFWRTVIGVMLMLPVAIIKRQGWPNRAAWRLHLIRSTISTIMAFTFFWGIARVPLAEGIALSFISPIIALYLASVFLNEEIGGRAIAASALGFLGVVVIASGRIGGAFSADALWGIAAILLSSLFYAGNLVVMRMQARVAGPTEIALMQSLIVGLILACFWPVFGMIPSTAQFPAIGLSALLTIVSLILLAWAYARAEAQHLLPVEYTAFIWAAIIGYMMFDERVTLITIAGTLLIIAGCLIAARAKPV